MTESRCEKTTSSVRRRRLDTLPKETNDEYIIFHFHQEKPEPSIMVPVRVNGENFSMELDAGVSVSTMSEEIWRRQFTESSIIGVPN